MTLIILYLNSVETVGRFNVLKNKYLRILFYATQQNLIKVSAILPKIGKIQQLISEKYIIILSFILYIYFK